jgi:hypothetical protein
MTMTTNNRVTLSEAADLIIAMGSGARVLLQGEKGIGKSSIMGTLRDRLGDDYHYCYFDCSGKDIGDVGLPWADHEKGVTKYLPVEEFGFHTGKPLVVMLDEFSKASRPAKNALHPLLEQHNARLFGQSLPEGSIVILTGNLSEEGLGDEVPEHTRDRVVLVEVSKPVAREWLQWAVQSDVNPAVLAFVNQFPQVLASFRDDDFDVDNIYVFNPRKQGSGKYATPRSLKQASNIVDKRDKFSTNAFEAALVGAVGAATARDLLAYVAFSDDLPRIEDVEASPKTAKIPESAGARVVMLFSLERRLTKENIDAIMTYVERLGEEMMMIFCSTLAKSESKSGIAFKNKLFSGWLTANADLI